MNSNRIDNILIIKLSSIGDCLLATPAIESIRRRYPDSFIAWLIEGKSKDIALLNPHVDEVLVINKDKFKIRDYFSLIKKLRRRKFDLAIDLQGVDRTSIFSFLSGAKMRYVVEYAKLSFLSTKKINKEGRPIEHAVDFYLFLAEKCGGKKISNVNLTLVTGKEDKKFADVFLDGNFSIRRNNIFVGINPAGTWKTKRWPIKYFIELSKRLISSFDLNMVIFGGKGDESLAQDILKGVSSDNIKSVVSKTTLKQAKELLARMDYFITPDSGLMHIASSIESLKTIALFGSTDPALTGPFGVNNVVLRDNLYCMPCFKKECPLNKIENENFKECVLCMRRITPDIVFDVINKDIQGNNT